MSITVLFYSKYIKKSTDRSAVLIQIGSQIVSDAQVTLCVGMTVWSQQSRLVGDNIAAVTGHESRYLGIGSSRIGIEYQARMPSIRREKMQGLEIIETIQLVAGSDRSVQSPQLAPFWVDISSAVADPEAVHESIPGRIVSIAYVPRIVPAVAAGFGKAHQNQATI